MKTIALLFSMFFFFSVTIAQKNSADNQKSHRIEKIINSNWTFNYFPNGRTNKTYESPALDDSKWLAVSIPYTWNNYETTGELHPFIRNASESANPYWWLGWGWYRKHFSVNADLSGKKVFIEFEGVQKYCKVWLNGKYLGDHKGGYGSFDFDITDLIRQNANNVLAVAVMNRQDDEFKIPPMAPDNFDVYGGIYRDVTIVLCDKLFIPMQGSASHEGGTFITTPKVSAKEGVVRVQTWVKNDNTEKKSCTLHTSIFDASDKVIQVLKSEAEINPGEIYMFDQTSKSVKNPHLWSNEDPYLYKVYSQVIDEKTVTDDYTSPLGFRWIRWDYKENFLYINGQKAVIRGGIYHHEFPWLGGAIPKWITSMDFKDMIENLNFNFIKTSHFPNEKYVYDLADKYGISIEEELPNIHNQDFSSDVQVQQLKEMIRRDRNHPSIMFWSMGSETNRATDSKFAVNEDTTRILTADRVTKGSAGTIIKLTEKNLSVENLLGSNIRGWCPKENIALGPADIRQKEKGDSQNNTVKVSGSFRPEANCVCLYDDYGDNLENPDSPLMNIETSGAVDIYRVPKYAYYLWKSAYDKNPVIFIQPYFWKSQYLGADEGYYD